VAVSQACAFTTMVQCRKNVIVLGSEQEEPNQNGSNHLLRIQYLVF
jgi:hypothetical protein